eukprot:TRINITY_DN1110_c0_g1_i2.p1 TRINITY_DN1110_c0_g1~~TRINITY_DN1110_c0_g1_i2.p1  ORF type:complete len:296 (+),score=28.18 TRINITY_DN1110_c0_g1_i2:557-1444(+)
MFPVTRSYTWNVFISLKQSKASWILSGPCFDSFQAGGVLSSQCKIDLSSQSPWIVQIPVSSSAFSVYAMLDDLWGGTNVTALRATVEYLEISATNESPIAQVVSAVQDKSCSLTAENIPVPSDSSVVLTCLRSPSSVSLNLQISSNGPLRIFLTDIVDSQKLRYRQAGARCLSATPPGPIVSLAQNCPPFTSTGGLASVVVPQSSTGLTVTILNAGASATTISRLSIAEAFSDFAPRPVDIPSTISQAEQPTLPTGVLVGIIIGCILAVLLIAAIAFFILAEAIRRRQSRLQRRR